LQVLDDGPGGSRDVTGLTTRSTATNLQNGDLALPMFVDQGGSAFSNNLDTDPPQIVGFAARIAINPALLADNRLLVQFDLEHTLGDASRANYVLDQLESMNFISGTSPVANAGRHQLNGSVQQLIEQVLNYQGTTIGTALSARADRQLTLDTISTQMAEEYGVDIDEEMARLTELQSAYAANARVVSVVKELLDTLFAST
jgi:flagellar hook-associated protein 1 FlgK